MPATTWKRKIVKQVLLFVIYLLVILEIGARLLLGFPPLFRRIRLRPQFQQEISRGVVFNSVSHWLTPEHRVAAQEIAAFLINRRLLPPNPAKSTGLAVARNLR